MTTVSVFKGVLLGVAISAAGAACNSPTTLRLVEIDPNTCEDIAQDIRWEHGTQLRTQLAGAIRAEGNDLGEVSGDLDLNAQQAGEVVSGMDAATAAWARQRTALCVDQRNDVYADSLSEYRRQSACLAGWHRDLVSYSATIANTELGATQRIQALDRILSRDCGRTPTAGDETAVAPTAQGGDGGDGGDGDGGGDGGDGAPGGNATVTVN